MNDGRNQNTRGRAALDFITVLARWTVGAVFVYMGLVKGLNPVGFLKQVWKYEMLTTPFLLNSVAAALPWFEVFCGLLLLAGVWVRGAALAILGMLIPFTALV